MNRQLIINADDYGLTKAVSEGIRYGNKKGIVTSTTSLMNFPDTSHEIEIALDEVPGLQIGVHLNFTAGNPILPPEEIPSLVNSNGVFYSRSEVMLIIENININDLEREWRAQINALLQISGSISHIDSHMHAATWRSDIWELYIALANEFKCGARLPHSLPGNLINKAREMGLDQKIIEILTANNDDKLSSLHRRNNACSDISVSLFDQDDISPEYVKRKIENLPFGISEWICHPGYTDSILMNISSYNKQRELELDCLTNKQVIKAIEKNNIRLIGFKDLS